MDYRQHLVGLFEELRSYITKSFQKTAQFEYVYAHQRFVLILTRQSDVIFTADLNSDVIFTTNVFVSTSRSYTIKWSFSFINLIVMSDTLTLTPDFYYRPDLLTLILTVRARVQIR